MQWSSFKDPKVVTNIVLLILAVLNSLGVPLYFTQDQVAHAVSIFATAFNGLAHAHVSSTTHSSAWLIFALLLSASLFACSPQQSQASLSSACSAYSGALIRLAQYRAAGKLTLGDIHIVNDANTIVIGDPANGKAGICTAPAPPLDAQAALAGVFAHTADLTNIIVRMGGSE